MVADVRPYELMKLRMLNGSHSMIAYLGYLAGYQYVSDAIANPVLRKLIHDFMTDEAMPCLPGTLDRIAYREALLARFGNPSLRHRTWQIAWMEARSSRSAFSAPFEIDWRQAAGSRERRSASQHGCATPAAGTTMAGLSMSRIRWQIASATQQLVRAARGGA